jgi:hypothetical protein
LYKVRILAIHCMERVKPSINIGISIFLYLGCAGLGLRVLLDIVHSYASADELVGLSLFDGSNDCYFHSGIITKSLLYLELFSNSVLLSRKVRKNSRYEYCIGLDR